MGRIVRNLTVGALVLLVVAGSAAVDTASGLLGGRRDGAGGGTLLTGYVPASELVRIASGREPGGRSWATFLYPAKSLNGDQRICLVAQLTREVAGRKSVLASSPSCHSSAGH